MMWPCSSIAQVNRSSMIKIFTKRKMPIPISNYIYIYDECRKGIKLVGYGFSGRNCMFERCLNDCQ